MQNIHSFIGKPTQNSLLMSSQSMMKQPSRQFQCPRGSKRRSEHSRAAQKRTDKEHQQSRLRTSI